MMSPIATLFFQLPHRLGWSAVNGSSILPWPSSEVLLSFLLVAWFDLFFFFPLCSGLASPELQRARFSPLSSFVLELRVPSSFALTDSTSVVVGSFLSEGNSFEMCV